jgi:GTP-binding protein
VVCVGEDGEAESFRVSKLFGTRGIERVELQEGSAGDIVILAGVDSVQVGDTICDPGAIDPLPRIAIDPPTIRVDFQVNTSPFAGREGKYVTSRQLAERLERETLSNVSIEVESGKRQDSFTVAGRGELQISVLIETMRREGYEFAVSRPEIILREIEGRSCEPVEQVVVDAPEGCAGSVMEKLSARRGRMVSMEQQSGRVRFEWVAPSRGLFGYRSEFLTDTRGEGVLYRSVTGYEPFAGVIEGRGVGSIVASETSRATAHAISKIQERATLFIGAGDEVYEGQVVGENRRPGDMNVNVCRAKQLTNIRAAGKDDSPILTPPRRLTIDAALEWMADDELLEATPKSLRLRKRILSASHRKR